MGLTSGTKLGPYEIVSPLGAGGMGEVYRARDMRLERDVCLAWLFAVSGRGHAPGAGVRHGRAGTHSLPSFHGEAHRRAVNQHAVPIASSEAECESTVIDALVGR
jgi:hypothetical protein